MSPQGKLLNQNKAVEFSNKDHLVIVCGRYEGIDQRAINHGVDEEISIGDFIVSGGELPSLIVMDSITRLIPGVLGDEDSKRVESFEDGLLEYPQYTRPKVWKDAQNNSHEVPKVLLSGHHEQIKQWRASKSIEKTKLIRPDLLEKEKKEQE